MLSLFVLGSNMSFSDNVLVFFQSYIADRLCNPKEMGHFHDKFSITEIEISEFGPNNNIGPKTMINSWLILKLVTSAKIDS